MYAMNYTSTAVLLCNFLIAIVTWCIVEYSTSFMAKPEAIMLLVLPIIPSKISHIFYPLFLFYSHAISY